MLSKSKNKIKKSPFLFIPTSVNIIFLFLIGAICLVPFLYVLSVSFTDSATLSDFGARLIPKKWSFEAYSFILQYPQKIRNAYLSSVFITIVGTIVALIVTASIAYALSRKSLPGRKFFMQYIFFSMMFGGGLIPTYLVVRTIFQGSIWSIICTGAFSAWNMILMKNFFQSLPPSLEESALLDGANEMQVLFRIVIPLSKSVLATIGLFYAVGFWNQWYGALLFVDNQDQWPLMMFLKTMLDSINVGSSLAGGSRSVVTSESMRMGVVVFCTIPILCVYPFVQKYFVKGVMVGSIKG